MSRDPHRFVNELDDDAVDRLISRLENRAKDAVFTDLWSRYVDRLELPEGFRLLEVGCGTGCVSRTIARRTVSVGDVVGVEQSPAFVNAAIRFARQEGLGDRVRFCVGDAHHLGFPAGVFDVVIAHTVISHVTDPLMVLDEMARVVKPGGMIVIFDGDYGSLSYAHPDAAFGRHMDDALARATFNNPTIMRELPRYLTGHGLQIIDAWGETVAEIGDASYFRSFAATYVPYVLHAGELPADDVERWHAEQREAMTAGQFFASCNYYTYLLRHDRSRSAGTGRP